MEDKLSIKSVFNRLKSKTPKFWKQLRGWMIALGALGLIMKNLPTEDTAWLLAHSWVPDDLFSIMITIGAVGTFLASLTKKDNPEP